MIKTILFDVDGISVHREMNFSERYAQEFGVPIEKVTPFYFNEFQPCLVGKADLKIEIEKYLLAWGWTKSVDELIKYWFEHENKLDQTFLNSLEALKDKGVTCYLQTRNEKYRVNYLWNDLGLKNYFIDIFDSAKLGCKKPEIEFWAAIYDQLGQCPKEEVLVWDDKQENVDSARQFGFQAELFTTYDEYTKTLKKHLL